jgi:hypothetical protein
MDSAIERIIIESLDSMEKGQSIDAIIESHPEHSAELKSILETAKSLNSIKVAHSLGAQAQSQKRFLEKAAAMQTVDRDRGRPIIMLWRRIAYSAGIIAMILIISTALVAFASQSALPGNPLYGAKRTIEEFRLSLATDTVLNNTLSTQFEKERISEIEALLNSGRDSDGLEFSGELLIQEDGSWIIEGLPIEQTEATIISGQPATGHRVKVIANLRDGKLFALEISSQDPLEIRPDPESDGIPSPPVDEKITPAETPEPMPTTTPSPDSEGFDSSIETPQADASPSPTPDLIPTTEATPDPADDVDDGDETDNTNGEEDNSGSGDDEEDQEDSGSGDDEEDDEEDDEDSGSGDDEEDDEEDEEDSGAGDDEEDEEDGSSGDD